MFPYILVTFWKTYWAVFRLSLAVILFNAFFFLNNGFLFSHRDLRIDSHLDSLMRIKQERFLRLFLNWLLDHARIFWNGVLNNILIKWRHFLIAEFNLGMIFFFRRNLTGFGRFNNHSFGLCFFFTLHSWFFHSLLFVLLKWFFYGDRYWRRCHKIYHILSREIQRLIQGRINNWLTLFNSWISCFSLTDFWIISIRIQNISDLVIWWNLLS